MGNSSQLAPFHGDSNLICAMDVVASHANLFLETGTHFGMSFCYWAGRHPGMRCLSCEIKPEYHGVAVAKVVSQGLVNAEVYLEKSEEFLPRILAGVEADVVPMCWLDAHWFKEWPLRFEVLYLLGQFTSVYLFIDDFKVPGRPDLHYDRYPKRGGPGAQECSLEYITPSIPADVPVDIWMPADPVSEKNKGKGVGWCLLARGVDGDTARRMSKLPLAHQPLVRLEGREELTVI